MPKISDKGGEKRQKCKRSSSSIGYSSEKKKTLADQNHFSLPIVGKHIQPKPYVDRFARPVQSNVRLCQLQQQQKLNKNKQIQNGTTTLRRSASTSRIISINSRNSNSTEGENDTDRKVIEATPERENKRKVEQNLRENQSEKQENEILQKNLIKEALNQENIKNTIDDEEEEEINSENNTIKNNRFEDSENSFQEALARAHEENERLREELLKNDFANNKKKGKKKVFSSVNEIVFETFFKVCNEEMEILNRRLVNMSVRDYSDIFAEINKILHEPFSFRLMEINSKCSVLFESLKLESTEKEELYIQLDRFLKEKIYPISKAVDSFLGTLRESALIAKESARACTVFSQWSREFGDQLQLHPDWNLMIYKIRDLQNREQGLPRHWLPPSLMPLLEVLIFERKNWADEGQKKEHELTESLKEANEKIKRLEAELEKRSLNGPQNLADPLQKINRIIQKDSKERANSIPLILLPVSNDSSSPTRNSDEFDLPLGQRSPRGEKKQQSPRSPRKPLISPRTPRSARSSRGSFKLASGASEEYESSQQHSPHQEAHVDSPHTPPPSYRVRSVLGARPLPALELRALVEAAKVAKENQDNEDELPWGDKIPEPLEEEEKKSERNMEETVDEDDIENQEVTQIDLSVPVEETPNGENEMMEIPRESPNKNTENGDDHNEMFENENGTLLESDKSTFLRDSTKILSENDDLENKSDEHNDQEEFEKIEKEILFQTKDENNILNKTKQDNKKESSVLIPSKATRYKTFEFWGFAHSLANILNMELPTREAINYQFYNSLSRPQSADEFDARLKAVDSIQEKLKLVMNEVKKVHNENGTN
ncbi:unnamed protein product [Meloidogyne enterolobii]|uniref:Uncharacterized protein n=1 Tax=Meloidogyne enterolobii TaxID=390850 RepID=A0ACB1AM45_MELEN